MKIIKFPGAAQPISSKPSPDPISRLHVGPVSLTCTNCSETVTAEFRGMVFRTLDCYCLCCGAFYRVTNPAFAPIPPQPKPPGSTSNQSKPKR